MCSSKIELGCIKIKLEICGLELLLIAIEYIMPFITKYFTKILKENFQEVFSRIYNHYVISYDNSSLLLVNQL